LAGNAEQEIARLMAEGLDAYGQDQVERAVACWREVLVRNPDHQVARDYLEAAGHGEASAESSPGEVPELDLGPPLATLVSEALEQLSAGQWAEALQLLEAAAPDDLEAQATLDLLRTHLYERYRQRTGHGAGVPGVRLSPDEILAFNLPPNAGFLLSMVDGNTTADDLVALSGMDPFDALHVLTKLVDAGIVSVQT